MHVKGIFLKGADQGRAFCAGGDVRTVVLKQRAGQVSTLRPSPPPLTSIACGPHHNSGKERRQWRCGTVALATPHWGCTSQGD